MVEDLEVYSESYVWVFVYKYLSVCGYASAQVVCAILLGSNEQLQVSKICPVYFFSQYVGEIQQVSP